MIDSRLRVSSASLRTISSILTPTDSPLEEYIYIYSFIYLFSASSKTTAGLFLGCRRCQYNISFLLLSAPT